MKYIFLDIDGTLFDHSAGRIPESAYKAIELAREGGNKIFISTGRSCCLLNPVEDIESEGAISASGAFVQVGDEVIYEENIPQEEIDNIVKYCNECDVAYILEGKKRVYMNFSISDFYDMSNPDNKSINDFFTQDLFHPITSYQPGEDIIFKMSLYALEQDNLYKLRERLPDKYHMIISQPNKNIPFSSELTLKKNNKASGIQKILDYYGADMKDTIAIGDSLNDLEMIQESAVGIAMGNADERLKEHADFITTDIDKDGIYLAFKKYGMI